MNERTLELYRQAHVPHTMIDPSNNMPVPSTIFSAEKFAELLEKEYFSAGYIEGRSDGTMETALECANFVENVFDDDGGHATCEDYAKGIKQRFGVE